MACPESLETLKNIEQLLKIMANELPAINERYNDWDLRRNGKSLFFSKTITYDASGTQQAVIDFPRDVQINWIWQIWNDATAKDSDVRLYVNPSSTAYAALDTQTANTQTSRLLLHGEQYPSGTRLLIQYANYTADKTVTVKVNATEL